MKKSTVMLAMACAVSPLIFSACATSESAGINTPVAQVGIRDNATCNIHPETTLFRLSPWVWFDGTTVNGLEMSLAESGGSGHLHGLGLSTYHHHYSSAGLLMALFGNVSEGDVYGVQLAAICRNKSHYMSGLQAALITNKATSDVDGVQASILYNLSEYFNGLQAGLFFNRASTLNGLQMLAGVNRVRHTINGVQNAIAGNYAVNANGLQSAILYNDVTENANGVQASVVLNSAEKFNGFQVAAVNSVENANGLQCAMVNDVISANGCQLSVLANMAEVFSGFQMGLVNKINKFGSAVQFGLINTAKDMNRDEKGAEVFQFGLMNYNGFYWFPFVNVRFAHEHENEPLY